MNNQVYKCERCGKLYTWTLSDLEKHDKEIDYRLIRRNQNIRIDDSSVGLCGECSIELTDWMNREKTGTAPTPEKKEEAPNYDELICNALVRELIERGMRMNRAES